MQHPQPPPTDPAVPKSSKVLDVGFIWLGGVVGAAFSSLTWAMQYFPSKCFTGFICWFAGWGAARVLHRSLAMITIMSLIYGLIIALTLAGLAFILLHNLH